MFEEPLYVLDNNVTLHAIASGTLVSNDQWREVLRLAVLNEMYLLNLNDASYYESIVKPRDVRTANEKLASLIGAKKDEVRLFSWIKFAIDSDRQMAAVLNCIERYRQFKLKPIEQQATILQNYGEVVRGYSDLQWQADIRIVWSNAWKTMTSYTGEIVNIDHIHKGDFLQLILVAKYLSTIRSHLFVVCSRINHSCMPNAAITTRKDGSNIVRSLVPINAGDEITICLDEDIASAPVYERRAILLERFRFICRCPRCESPGDDTRRFHCERQSSKSRCSGYHLVHQLSEPEPATLNPCNTCHHKASVEFTAAMLQLEKEVSVSFNRIKVFLEKKYPIEETRSQWRCIPNVRCLTSEEGDAFLVKLTKLRRTIHYHHYLSYLIGCLIRKMAHIKILVYIISPIPSLDLILASFKAEEECLSVVVPFPHYAKEIMYRYHADSFRLLDAGASADVVIKQAAIAFYQQMFRMSIILDHRTREYDYLNYASFKEKFYPFVHDLQESLKILPSTLECAVCCLKETECTMMRCNQCRRVSYCTKEHQKVAWPVHKASCFARPTKASKDSVEDFVAE